MIYNPCRHMSANSNVVNCSNMVLEAMLLRARGKRAMLEIILNKQ